MHSTLKTPTIAILLCTYQGEKYLAEQLDSIVIQEGVDPIIWASDDGSSDQTTAILKRYQEKLGKDRLHILQGPCQGFVKNFMSMVCNPNIQADYYAFADQDDIWMKDKSARALSFLNSISQKTPGLYCSRTLYVDEQNQVIGPSQPYQRPPSFNNALVQNIASGNTMVFNQAARDLLVAIGQNQPIVYHDWMLYLMVTACGGQVLFDQEPTVRYRQHSNNLIGMNTSFKSYLARIKILWGGRFATWNNIHTNTLSNMKALLTLQNQAILAGYIEARQKNRFACIYSLFKLKILRQTRIGQLGLCCIILINKF